MSKTILITGASTGIGRATAIYFAQKGWNVVATMRNPDAADASLRLPNINLLALDVTNESSIVAAFAEASKRFKKLDVLLNNAGYGLFGPLEALTPEQTKRQFETNVHGIFNTMRHIIPIMRVQRDGVIINISSIGGRMAFPFTSAYHATKFAVEGLSESVRFELKPQGIRIKIIEPGGIKTDFNSRSLEFVHHDAYQPQLTNYQALLKDDKYWARPEQVAQVIYRAATDGSYKLRYAAKPGPFFALHAVLPDYLWRAFGHFMLNIKPKTTT